jgi:L,D-transpeptidase ErfK/SrfK
MPSLRSGIPISPRVGGCPEVRQPLAGLGKVRLALNFGSLPGSVFPSSLRPIQGELGHLVRPLAGSFSLPPRPVDLSRFQLHLAPLLLIWLLPSLTSSGQAQPLPPASALPEQAASPALPAPPPPVGAAALLGPEPLSIGGDPMPTAPSPLPMAPAALEGPSGSAPGAAPAPSLAPAPTAAAAAPPRATATVVPPASPSAPPGTAPFPAATGPATPLDRALILDRQRRLLSLLENGRLVRRFPVAVGMPGWETPVGRFQVLNKTEYPVWEHPEKGTHTPAGPANPLGSRWIGFHQDCLGRRGWDGEHMLDVKGCVVAGFHGTPHRWTVGQALSHGCVRLYDEDVRQVFDFVSIGTPVTVLP